MKIAPFHVAVPQDALDDLRARLSRTRWPDALVGDGWDAGTDRDYLRERAGYWRDRFDWRAQEQVVNRFAHFRADVDGLGVHFIHERGRGPQPLPLLLTHGWPDSFLRMLKVIPLLVDPAAHGGSADDAFDVVVPSLPGYGFSDQPGEVFGAQHAAAVLAELMTKGLGYDRFAAQGGDIGSQVTEQLARKHARHLVGIHLTDVPTAHVFAVDEDDLSAKERAFVKAGKAWALEEGAYAHEHATKPQTLAFALNDSPAGLASWIVEKFRAWSDCGGKVERRFTKDELLANVTLYWLTGTIGSSFLPYYAATHDPAPGAGTRVDDVPAGMAMFPKDIAPAPREFAERIFDVRRWTEMPRGGHFAALEEPELLADDIRAFFRPLRQTAG